MKFASFLPSPKKLKEKETNRSVNEDEGLSLNEGICLSASHNLKNELKKSIKEIH